MAFCSGVQCQQAGKTDGRGCIHENLILLNFSCASVCQARTASCHKLLRKKTRANEAARGILAAPPRSAHWTSWAQLIISHAQRAGWPVVSLTEQAQVFLFRIGILEGSGAMFDDRRMTAGCVPHHSGTHIIFVYVPILKKGHNSYC